MGQESDRSLPECDRPGCITLPSKTYTGPNGNELSLCRECYYSLVTSGFDSEVPDGIPRPLPSYRRTGMETGRWVGP